MDNLYAPPKTHEPEAKQPHITTQGKTICLHNGAKLPHRCIKCNAPAEMPWVEKRYISTQFAIFRQKRVWLSVGLCARHKNQFRRWSIVKYIWFALCLCALALPLFSYKSPLPLWLFTSFFIYLMAEPRIAKVSYADTNEVRFTGAKAAFLQSLRK